MTWHIDEVFLKISGKPFYLWRAVDDEGEVLDILLQSRRNKVAAVKFLRRIIKRYQATPDIVVTDKWRASMAAVQDVLMRLRCGMLPSQIKPLVCPMKNFSLPR